MQASLETDVETLSPEVNRCRLCELRALLRHCLIWYWDSVARVEPLHRASFVQSLSVVGHMQSIAAGICTLQLAAFVATVPEDACGKI